MQPQQLPVVKRIQLDELADLLIIIVQLAGRVEIHVQFQENEVFAGNVEDADVKQRVLQRGNLRDMVIYLAALQGVPRELYEAATVDGANKWQQFRNVTLPQIKPTTFFCTIMLVIGSFKIYDTVAIMTNGGPGRATKMLVTYIYDVAFNNIKYGQASAIAMVLLVIVLIVTIIQFANEKKFAND